MIFSLVKKVLPTEGKWYLFQYISSPVFIREKFERQPGEPTHTTWTYKQEAKEQPLQSRLNCSGKSGNISNIKIQVDNYAEINLPVELKAGESIVCDGMENLRLYNENGKPKGCYRLSNSSPALHTIILDCAFNDGESPKLEM